MPKCSVRGCHFNYTPCKKNEVSFFSLPKDDELRNKWLRSIPIGLSSLKCPEVCENHFLLEDIIRTPKVEGEECCRRPLLKKNAVPSVFSVVPPDPHTAENDGNDQSYRCIVSYSSDSNESDYNPDCVEYNGPTDKIKSRKRVINSENRYQKRAKRLRNSGHHYVSKNKKNIPAKKFSNKRCKCKRNCNRHFSKDDRKSMFDNFWRIGDFKRQNAVICGLIQKFQIKRRRPRKLDGRFREGSHKYFLKSESGVTEQVCRNYFLNTFCVSVGRVSRALEKMSEGKIPGEDLRGHKGCPTRKISDGDIQFVVDHINSFPSYESHYTRNNNPNRKYLSDSLNVTKMYELYEEKCNSCGKNPVKKHYYRHVFNTKFNLHFYVPKKDTCKTCDIFKIKKCNPELSESEKDVLKAYHDLHLRKAELARACMKKDAVDAKTDPETYVCSMDLQKALPFPILTVSDAYYKRNCYCYNFGVHDLEKNVGYFYVWDETIASRGSQDIVSCLIKHLKLNASTKKKVTIYSDTCTGQNRTTLALMSLLQSEETDIEVIDQKFLVSGHSFLPNDSDFGCVELAAKGKSIYVPEHWYSIMKTCRRTNKFNVCQMNREEFFSTNNLEKNISRRKKNLSNRDVNWLKIRWISLEKQNPYYMKYKETLQDFIEFEVVDLSPTGRKGRPVLFKNLKKEKLYPNPRPVSIKKKSDMKDLLQFIPPVYHWYFNNLITTNAEDSLGPLPFESNENENSNGV